MNLCSNAQIFGPYSILVGVHLGKIWSNKHCHSFIDEYIFSWCAKYLEPFLPPLDQLDKAFEELVGVMEEVGAGDGIDPLEDKEDLMYIECQDMSIQTDASSEVLLGTMCRCK